MRGWSWLILGCGLLGAARAQEVDGAALYQARCVACHGARVPLGEAPIPRFRALHAALEPGDPREREALAAFRRARRAALLSAQDLPPLALETGERPPVPPRWVLLPWKWKNEHSGWADVEEDAALLERHDLPTGAYMIDSPWSSGYGSLRFHAPRFGREGERVPGERMVRALQARGLKVLLWCTAIVNDGSKSSPPWEPEVERALHAEGEARGLFYSEPAWRAILGRKLEAPRIRWWKGVGSHIDLTRAEGQRWWYELMDRALVDLGVDGFKVDGGWPPLTDDYYFHTAAHVARRTGGRGATLSRPRGGNLSTATACWTGDEEPDWQGMELALTRMRLAAEKGYGAVGSDIGGFGGPPSEAVLVRWAQLGCVSGVMELGGGGVHEPWAISPRCLELYRFYAHLRCELGPYLHDATHRAHEEGTPLLRFPEREAFLVGEDLYAAPCRFEQGARDLRLPDGRRWLDFFDPARTFEAGKRHRIDVPDLARFPLFVREWSVLPLECASDVTGLGAPEAADALTLAVFAPPRAEVVNLSCPFRWGDDPRPERTTFMLGSQPPRLTLSLKGRALAWPRLVVRVANRSFVSGSARRGDATIALRVANSRADLWTGAPDALWVDAAQRITWIRLASAELSSLELVE